MKNDHIVAVNLPADGLFLAILTKAEGDLSRENCTRLIRNFIQRFLDASPDIILLNVCYRRALTPSQVFDSYLYNIETDENGYALRDENGQTIKHLSPVSEKKGTVYFSAFRDGARVLLQNGIDIYEILTKQIRDAGCKCYLSLRMNDAHNTDNPAVNSYFAMKNGGRHSVAGDGKNLDFSQEAVQNHFYAYIEELLQTYKVDGIELDWLRFPQSIPPEKRSDYGIINGYMHRVRKLLDSFDPELRLAVRLYPCEEKNLGYGFDVAQWLCDGTADMFTMENFYVPTNFEMPVNAWRESIAKRNTKNRPYTLLCGSDWGVCCCAGRHIPMNPALVRGYATTSLQAGADGLYLFNFFEENHDSSWELKDDGTLENCFSSRLFAAREPHGLPRRHIHMGDTTNRYPIMLAPGESYRFSYAHNTGRAKLLLGCDLDAFAVSANGQQLPLTDEPVLPGYAYPPTTKSDFVYAVTQLSKIVKVADLPADPLLEITVENRSSQPANITWLELSFTK